MSKTTLSNCPNCGQGQPEVTNTQSSPWDMACFICPICGYSNKIGEFINKILRDSSPHPSVFDLDYNWKVVGSDPGELVLEVTAATMAEIKAAASIHEQFYPLFASYEITNPSPTSIFCMVCNNPHLEPTPNGEHMACNSGHYKITKVHYLVQYVEGLGYQTLLKADKESVSVRTYVQVPTRSFLGITLAARRTLVPVANIWIGHRQHKTKPEVFLLSKPDGFNLKLYTNLLNTMRSHFKNGFEILEKKQ